MENVKNSNTFFNAVKLKPTEKIIAVHENGLADANFVLSSFMEKAFSEENNKVCLVALHNTLGHYQNVGKRLNYNFLNKVDSGHAVIIEFLKIVANTFENDNENLNNKEAIVKELFLEVNGKIEKLLKDQIDGQVYLIIDDISHLLDLGVDVRHVVTFLNCCINLTANNQIVVVINCHISSTKDEIVANALTYAADVTIDISSLKTGMSHDVTGVIKIKRDDGEQNRENSLKQNFFHYRAYDREIRVFAPGTSLFYMRK